MSESKDHIQSQPFEVLGTKLKHMREHAKESLAEVSGAVEIDVNQLNSIESGEQRPAEEILLLLISHFGVKEDEAMKLWELAGYEQSATESKSVMNDDNGNPQSSVMVMPLDARIVYTDMVHVMVNNYGVVMNFMQGAGPNNQPLAISRIGMSKEHAKSVLKVLQETLEISDQTAEASDSADMTAEGETPEPGNNNTSSEAKTDKSGKDKTGKKSDKKTGKNETKQASDEKKKSDA
jgi:transcriptional regulator with XRE-family HTH domain